MTLILLFAALSCASGTGSENGDRSKWRLGSKQEASVRAASYIPESDTAIDDIKETARLTVFKNDNTPFLSNNINNRHGWRIQISTTLRLERWAPSDSQDTRERQFTLSFDAEAGTLVRISYIAEDDYSHKTETLNADSAEKVLRAAGEIFHGFPRQDPEVSFTEALEYVYGNPFTAKEIHGWYLMYSRHGEKPHPVWVIDLRGVEPPFEPINAAAGNIPIENRNHMRSVIDAKTGVHITSANFPVW